jgi:hypothetical protein
LERETARVVELEAELQDAHAKNEALEEGQHK